ncbi:hypothetical protein ACTFJW_04955 [Clostridium cagae]|uniref:hypothetical protein n=1 Tax=Clostridium cagae TaxID=2080751 RepID=UPI003F75EAB6
MAKIKFDIEINGAKIDSYMNLEGQQLYFFNQGSEKEKQAWINCYLERIMKITNIEIKE